METENPWRGTRQQILSRTAPLFGKGPGLYRPPNPKAPDIALAPQLQKLPDGCGKVFLLLDRSVKEDPTVETVGGVQVTTFPQMTLEIVGVDVDILPS